jgi:hypothetical protein
MMDSVVAHFAQDSGWAGEVREFGEEAVHAELIDLDCYIFRLIKESSSGNTHQ